MSDFQHPAPYQPAGPPPGPPVGPPSVAAGGGNMGRASVVGAARPKPVPGAAKQGRKKKRMSKRRRRVYAALIMACLMMLGAVTVAGSWFFNDVPTPEDLKFGESTTFTYSDGETQIAGYGEYTRKLVDKYEDIPDQVVWSLLALEDKDYFEHEGVDYKGTMRALINNLKGGDTQGASTISQQYAGMVSDIRGDISYGRKAKEAVMAMKLEQDTSKTDILLHYLNLNFYGRGAYGIEAASEVWFGKKVQDLNWAEGMMLVMQVKAGDGSFDPRVAEEGSTAPLDRWTFGMETLLTMTEDLSDEQLAEVQAQLDAGMPETKKALENPGSWGHNTPTGFITNPTDGYIWDELESRYGLTQSEFYGEKENTGGYTVALTIDKDIQAAAVSTASRGELERKKNENGELIDDNEQVVTDKAAAAEYVNEDGFFEFEDSNENAALYEYNKSMADAVAAVEPGTGAVRGYFGGVNGLGVDKAGVENPHPPSSTFKMVTAATAILEGASIDSWWNSDSPREFEGREDPVSNAGRTENTDMTLTEAVRQSRNTPMYAIAEKYGATTVLETAIRMGLRTMQNTGTGDIYRFYIEDDDTITYSLHNIVEDGEGYITDVNGNIDPLASVNGYDDDENPIRTPLDLDDPRFPFDYEIGFGQFPTSVLDMATVYATIANNGTHVETHFVEAVYKRDGTKVEPIRGLEETPALDAGIAQDLQFVGSTIDGDAGAIDRAYTGKTGTWEAGDDYPDDANAHTWYVGAIPQMSIAAWVGNATAESAPLLNKEGTTDDVFGGTLSYPVWKKFMEATIEAKGYDKEDWAPPVRSGSPIVEDIVNEDGTIDADSPYCAANPTDTRCARATPPGGGNDACDPISEYLGLCQPGNNNGGGGGGGGGGRDDD